jgi:hypothetical protein
MERQTERHAKANAWAGTRRRERPLYEHPPAIKVEAFAEARIMANPGDANEDSLKRNESRLASWTGVGVAIGVALGAAFGNIGVGIAIGVAIGAAIGAARDARRKRER